MICVRHVLVQTPMREDEEKPEEARNIVKAQCRPNFCKQKRERGENALDCNAVLRNFW